MSECLICASKELLDLLKFGDLPVCHKFSKKSPVFNFNIGQCRDCGLVQLLNFVPLNELTPIYDWIQYKEPEGHLDRLTSKIIDLHLSNNNSAIIGLSEKDTSLVSRFKNNGFKNTYCIKNSDLNITDKLKGIETIQKCISENIPSSLMEKQSKADLVIARHIFEHVRSPKSFLTNIFKLVKENGFVLLEVPDYSTAFKNNDYSTLWEEHTMYFTPDTIVNSLITLGYEILFYETYKYTHENCIAVLIKKNKKANKDNLNIDNQLVLMKNYKKNYPLIKKTFFEKFKILKNKSKKIALYGTGHNALMFLNLMGLHELIDCVIDDDINKVNKTLPNTNLRIIDSSHLYSEKIDICILAVSTESEDVIRANHKEYLDSGSLFFSIYSEDILRDDALRANY